jgi:putative cardiolipin synthase
MSSRSRIGTALAILLWLAGGATWASSRVRLVTTAAEATHAHDALLAGAQETIDADYFIVGADPFTYSELALLRDAARRGVHVRLLADAHWNRVPRAVQAALAADGVEIRGFHPWRPTRPGWIARRLHDKLLVVDSDTLLAGGRNIEAPYFGCGAQVGRRDYVDCDLEIHGEAAGEARAYFDRLWASRQVAAAHFQLSLRRLARGRAILDGAAAPHARLPPGVEPDGDLLQVESVRFVHDALPSKGLHGGTHDAILGLIDGARESLVIESPYVVTSRRMRRALGDAVDRGVHVRILTNSLASTDNLWAQAGYVGHRRELVRGGIELWEQRGPDCLHAKAMVIDAATVVVASYNLHPRSEDLDRELALVVGDAELSRRLRAVMDAHLDAAWRLDADGMPEGSTVRHPGVSRWKLVRLFFHRLLAVLVKRQL